MSVDDWNLQTSHTDRIDTDGVTLTPVLHLRFSGHSNELMAQLPNTGTGNEYPEDIDVAFQLQAPPDDSDASGDLTVSDRLTGEYIIEFEVAAKRVFEFVRSVHEYADVTGNEVSYIVSLDAEDGTAMEFQNQVLIVRTTDGELYRTLSLIPTWVDF